ncbi:MAG TPA: DUF1684 domain-containing protein [Puia sp.]|jgi:uncharacterized protein (DUF1684 family)|nr:DUF1684 domain-containing protein [Puia sp.]
MKQLFVATLLLFSVIAGQAQKNNAYLDSMQAFRKDYIETHGVVKTKEDQAFLQFFPIDASYRVKCSFERLTNSEWFPMATSGTRSKMHRKYGKLTFSIHDTTLHLFVYQSQDLLQSAEERDYLFIPFSDKTSGEESYGAGRYLECYIKDVRDGTLVLDFNKAYNPYCAYTSGYNCPIPPRENDLPIGIRAGERNYGKKVH